MDGGSLRPFLAGETQVPLFAALLWRSRTMSDDRPHGPPRQPHRAGLMRSESPYYNSDIFGAVFVAGQDLPRFKGVSSNE